MCINKTEIGHTKIPLSSPDAAGWFPLATMLLLLLLLPVAARGKTNEIPPSQYSSLPTPSS